MSPPSFRLIAALSVAAVAASGVDGSKSGVMAPQSIVDEPRAAPQPRKRNMGLPWTSRVNSVVAKTAALAVDGSGSLVEEKQERLMRRQESKWSADTVDSPNAYVVSSVLGAGGFGEVREAAPASQRSTESGFKYVCKFALPGESAEETHESQQMLQHEAEVMRELETAQCPGVMRLVETGPIFSCAPKDESDPSCKEGAADQLKPIPGGLLMMERMDMDLFDWIEKNYNGPKGLVAKCENGIMRQLEDALARMHEIGWVHMDVKTENVFLRGDDADGCPAEVFLADFGLADRKGASRACLPTAWLNDPAAQIYPRQVFCDRGDHFEAVPGIDAFGLMVIAHSFQ